MRVVPAKHILFSCDISLQILKLKFNFIKCHVTYLYKNSYNLKYRHFINIYNFSSKVLFLIRKQKIFNALPATRYMRNLNYWLLLPTIRFISSWYQPQDTTIAHTITHSRNANCIMYDFGFHDIPRRMLKLCQCLGKCCSCHLQGGFANSSMEPAIGSGLEVKPWMDETNERVAILSSVLPKT